MSHAATVYEVMIASPGDLSTERAIVRELLAEWNIVNSRRSHRVLLPAGWETHAVPEMGDRPQAIINKQVLNNCDLLIGVFWTRIGTPTGDYASGSVEEIEEHIKAGRPTMLYFSSAPVVPESIEPEQYASLQEFKRSCQTRGLYESYADLQEFRTKLYRQLQLKLNNDAHFQSDAGNFTADIEPATNLVRLSKEASYLLKECASDLSGHIMNLSYIGGRAIQVNGKNVIEEGSDRSRAIWTSALDELENAGYINALNHKREMFQITKAGYEAADLLS